MTVITFGGLAGAGARSIGPLVARRLEADYVDRLILTDVARHVGATVEALHQREERPPTTGERFSRLLQRILERSAVTGAGGDPYFGPGVAAFLTEEYEDLPQPTITRGHELEDEKYIEGVRKVMREMAGSGNVVLVGRGGHVILRDLPDVLRVGVMAPMEARINTIVHREQLDLQRATETVEARDKARAYYFKRFFDIDEPDAPELYHFVINTSEISPEYAVDMIIHACDAMREGTLPKKVSVVA